METIDIIIYFVFGVLLGCLFQAFLYKAIKHSFTRFPIWSIGDKAWTAVGNEKILITIEKYRLYYDWADKSEHVIYTVKNSSGHKWEVDEVYLWANPS